MLWGYPAQETTEMRAHRPALFCHIPAKHKAASSSSLAIFAVLWFGLAATASAQNISQGKPYAYFQTVPGQAPNHYRDDGPINGPHLVHTTGLGTFGLGNLSDGAISAFTNGGPNTAHLAIWSGSLGVVAPATDVIFDLGGPFIITDFVIGTTVAAVSNNNPPDDVTISYSTTGTAPADFSSAKFYDMEAMYGPLTDGHHDMPLGGSGIAARYVKFAFDGGSMREPGGEDPDEKYMFDEITINGFPGGGIGNSAPFGSGCMGSNGVPNLIATAGSTPKLGSNFSMDISNLVLPSSPVFILAGFSAEKMGNGVPLPFDLSVIGATGCSILVDPLASGGTGSTNGSGTFTIPIPMSTALTGLVVYFQGVSFDPGANPLGLTSSNGLLTYLGN